MQPLSGGRSRPGEYSANATAEHFTADGTLIGAWASQKSFRSKDSSDD